MTTRREALVTGFPRLLARGLALRLLKRNHRDRVSLLVDPLHLEEAEAFRDTLSPGRKKRLQIAVGRVTDVDLGLPGPAAAELVDRTTHIFHADTVQTGTQASLRRRNVAPLVSMLGMAREMGGLRRFMMFSTAFVSGSRTGHILEEELDCGQSFRTPYERSMFDCEHICREWMPRLPLTVVRPASMLGHSRTGEADGLTEGPNYLMRLLVRLPTEMPLFLPSTGVVPLNVVPVDYAVAAAVVLAERVEALGRTFHLTDPNPPSAREAFELLSHALNRPAPVTGALPVRALRGVLRLPGVRMLSEAQKQLSLLEELTRHVDYDCNGTLELLADTDVLCPPFESYAQQLADWVADYAGARVRSA